MRNYIFRDIDQLISQLKCPEIEHDNFDNENCGNSIINYVLHAFTVAFANRSCVRQKELPQVLIN